MTAPVSLDKITTVKHKPIPYGFLRYPGSWFYLIVTSVIGILWVAALIEATQIGAFAVDHLQEFSLQRVPFAVSIMLFLGFNSARTMYIQLKFY